ncbi:hypothetical protein [Nonomuraea sp. NPDC001831]|uniref:hypothetical protein n=1 Tax=Nonomuraea sp. NPDC001831 TaxID=3364340 RepID=UPI0036AA63E8
MVTGPRPTLGLESRVLIVRGSPAGVTVSVQLTLTPEVSFHHRVARVPAETRSSS